jgi:hypothetical protein
MAAQEGFGTTRLEEARSEARGLIDSLNKNDTLSLIAAGTRAQVLATGNVENRASLLAALDSLQAIGTGTNFAEAFTLAQITQQSTPQSPEGQIVVLSDMETPASSILPEEGFEWVRVGSTVNNQAIVALSAQPRRGGASGHNVYVRIANYDRKSVVSTLRLFGDDELINTRMVDLQATGEAELTWDLPAGIKLLRAELDHNDALEIDDQASISLESFRPVRAALVSQSPMILQRVLSVIPGITLAPVSPTDYAADAAQWNERSDLLVFDGVVPQEWPVGGVLIVNPPPGDHALFTVERSGDGAPQPDNTAAPAPDAAAPQTEAQPVALNVPEGASGILQGINLGSVSFGQLPDITAPDWAQVELQTRAGTPLILRGRTGESEVAIWTFDLMQGNLANRLAFPLLVARTVNDLTTPPLPESLMVGQNLTMQPDPRTDTVTLRHPDGETQRVDAEQTVIFEGLIEPGIYTLIEQADDQVVYEGRIPVNAGTPLESELRATPLLENAAPYLALAESSEADAADQAQNNPQPVWPWLAAVALGIILIEWLYVHWR